MNRIKLLLVQLFFCLAAYTQQCINLTTSPQWVNIGDLDVVGNQITVEALIYYQGGTNIISKHTDPSNVNYLLRVGTFELTTTNGFLLMNNPYAASMQTNTWYHVAGTYDGSFVRYYVNGCLIVEQAWSGNLITNDFDAAIGQQSFNLIEQFFGKIDEVRIWNVARTENQIANNMFDLPTPAAQTGLLAYYKFDGNLINAQGNVTYNGTWEGTPSFDVEPLPSVIPVFQINSIAVLDATCQYTSDGTITVNASGSNLEYSINGTDYQSSNQFLNLPVNTYTVYVRSQEGCVIEQESVQVGAPPLPTSPTIANNGSICSGNTGVFTLTGAPNLEVTYTLDGGTTTSVLQLDGTGEGEVTLPNLTTTTTLEVTLVDDGTCDQTPIGLTSTLVVDPLPVSPTIVNNGSICSGNTGVFTLTGAPNLEVTYTLDGGTTTSVLQLDGTGEGEVTLPNLTSTTTLEVILVDDGTCDQTPTGLTSTLEVHPLPSLVLISQDAEYCDYEEIDDVLVEAQGEPSFQIDYTINGTQQTQTSSNATISLGNEQGEYVIQFITDNNCTSEEYDLSIVIEVKPSPAQPDVLTDTTFCLQDKNKEIRVEEMNGVTYEWYLVNEDDFEFLEVGNVFVPFNTIGETFYTVIAVENECESEPQTIRVFIEDCQLEWPSAFTPNNDGVNDFWDLPLIDMLYPNNVVKVFNRWGELIYDHDSSKGMPYSENPWDGTYKGELMPIGSYLFIIELNNETKQTINGAVSLLLD